MLKITRKKDTYGDFNSFYGESDFNNMDISDENVTGFDAEPTPAPVTPDPVEPTPATVALKIINPKGYDEAPTIADFLLGGNTVLLNIEGLDRMNAIRLLDYLNGATHMVGGIMTKVSKTTLIVAPKNVDVSSIEAMVGSAE